MKLTLNPNRVEDYCLFLRIKSLPRFSVQGRTVEFPDEYSASLGLPAPKRSGGSHTPHAGLFDYQRDLALWAIRKQKAAIFADCGLGKTLIMLEFVRHCLEALPPGRCILIVSPLMVIAQTLAETLRFYGRVDLPIQRVPASELAAWLEHGATRIGITNYEAIREGLEPGALGALILDESSMLKSHYGAWGKRLIELGKGLPWKLCLTGTPAPNDRIEYANHAVFLDQFPTVNSFLARYFVNRGETNERWELKPHALRPFYVGMSHWSVFVTSPGAYGWKDNAQGVPEVRVHIHDVDLTQEQRGLVHQAGGDLFGTPGGITSRSTLARLAKGSHKGQRVASNKPAFIRDLIASWPEESTLVWCKYNDEQDDLAQALSGCGSMDGTTPQPERERLIAAFQAGDLKTLLSKPKIMGFGLNLHRATRQVFSTLQDSYEEYYQAVKRSNRVGSTKPLDVHIPVTDLERPMIETVLRKAARVKVDGDEQQTLFKEQWHGV